MRLLLFDIDGTLIHSGGVGRRAMLATYRELLGSVGGAETIEMAGMTDPLIARASFEGHGYSHAQIDALLPEIWRRYVVHLERELAAPSTGRGPQPCPGVPQLLERLRQHENVVQALLTGNVEEAAWLKLRAVGLNHYFTFGAFGNEGPERDKLPAVAIRKAERETGRRFAGRDVVIIGDTPADVACGRHLDVRTVAVATGPYDEEALRACGANVVLPDLMDTDQVLAALLA